MFPGTVVDGTRPGCMPGSDPGLQAFQPRGRPNFIGQGTEINRDATKNFPAGGQKLSGGRPKTRQNFIDFGQLLKKPQVKAHQKGARRPAVR